jgi:branched-chain amino acid transport system ATP-binding protein
MIDEMSLGLSPLLVQQISRVIKDINKSRRIAVFLVEQDVNMALSMADRGYIVENGRIQSQGTARALLDSDRIQEAYLGISPAGKGS